MTMSTKEPHYKEAQETRLVEVQAMSLAERQELWRQLRSASNLPKLDEHFRKHGTDFRDSCVTYSKQMEALFLKHIQRTDLEVFTYVSTQKTAYRLWALVGMDNGQVALYNETKKQFWSFMQPDDLQGYLDGGHGWWVKVDDFTAQSKVQRW